MLGKPAKTMHFALKGETEVDWRFALPATSPKLFTVVHGPDQRVLRTYTGDDMDAHENKGGGRWGMVCCWILKIEENKAQRA